MERNLKLKEFRQSRKMTQLELAGRSGVSHSFVEKLESGWLVPSRKIAEKLATAMNCSTIDIFPNIELK